MLQRLCGVISIQKTYLFPRHCSVYIMESTSTATNKKVEQFMKVMDEVYGPFQSGWKPKSYAENKSRYLWTDAFGVCNFITLFYETKEAKFLEQAKALIQDVHDTLGKDRSLTKRLGNSTDAHPLLGGLRIGKKYDEDHEDGDGQYFHYLTKWMFALNRMSIATKDSKYNDWAIELIQSTHKKFVYNVDTMNPHMYWKMSIDLSHPLVRSEGNLDPYDGYVTYRLVQRSAADSSVLNSEIKDMEKMVRAKYKYYRSDDPLDLGEALWISHWFPEEEWAQTMASRSLESIEKLFRRGYFEMPERYRLAFREFGTTLGLQVNEKAGKEWMKRVEDLHEYWSKRLYTRDKDITPMMFCASLIPGVWNSKYPM